MLSVTLRLIFCSRFQRCYLSHGATWWCRVSLVYPATRKPLPTAPRPQFRWGGVTDTLHDRQRWAKRFELASNRVQASHWSASSRQSRDWANLGIIWTGRVVILDNAGFDSFSVIIFHGWDVCGTGLEPTQETALLKNWWLSAGLFVYQELYIWLDTESLMRKGYLMAWTILVKMISQRNSQTQKVPPGINCMTNFRCFFSTDCYGNYML